MTNNAKLCRFPKHNPACLFYGTEIHFEFPLPTTDKVARSTAISRALLVTDNCVW
jgi:hypothetical protein